ncbi:hypothetical protein EYZ11_002860 [Aspergillus tanneri]|uniref:DUF7582 domain-containing protein n=1 Tax=Aspergillus tanneri TaxID=1220188 RepID=A0A4V3UQ48_9EURO|nr:uncharacterized protein ATNIH1004_001315 [Aspergillus tanneri]KAA8652411.1 hypothetical protein ATNIH1004_001315 [Aspergillus tanneri]THC97634.1 hypothetical protein EYZ11_002860 [Aspergillus tanneri]
MGVMRLPRPTGVYVPNSPTRNLTVDMISPPLSPGFNFDWETLPTSILPALEYISSKLQQKMMHVTLLVGRGKPFPTGQPSDLMVIPITALDAQASRALHRTIAKAANKFSLGSSWTDALARSQYERHANEYLMQQSIMQNEVVFSREGLTLLTVDRIYTFKRRLCILAHRGPNPDEESVASCVQLLHRTIQDFQGRPFSKAFFHRVYEQLDVRDDLLARIASMYLKEFGEEGIVMPSSASSSSSEKEIPKTRAKTIRKTASSVKTTATTQTTKPATTVRKSPMHSSIRARREPGPPRYRAPAKRGPKTPLSASDVTPITRNEWNMLVGTDFRHVKATVTKWTPSPIVLAAA